MARIGFKKAKYNLFDSSTGKYKALKDDKVPMFEKVVDEKFSAEFNSAELYGNDTLVESDYTFKSGTLSITICDDEDTFCAELLGNTIATDTESGEVRQNVNDTAPYIGYGHIVPKKVNGVSKYKVEFFPKVKVTSITTEASTKGDSPEFKTTSLEAKVYAVDTAIGKAVEGDWEIHKTFSTLAEAETYLDGLLTPSA